MRLFKGWFGEQKTELNLWFSLDKNLYQRFHDVIISSSNGTTQLDHILVSPYGVFIVETKNRTGWIFGSESQANWTQVVYKKKYSFQNPLRQIYRHKKVLSQYLNIDESYIEGVVFFNGDAQFKTELPPNVLNYGLGSYIKQYSDIVLSDTEIQRICDLLISTEGRVSKQEHLQSLHQRLTSDTVCPKCGSDLVVREVKGSKRGVHFLGCSSYPKCRFTKDIQSNKKANLLNILIVAFMLILLIGLVG